MRRINEDQRRRALLLSKRLEEFTAKIDKLMVQLGDLERERKVDQLEFNALHNLGAPISTLPDEMLAMIFKAGSFLEESHPHFGTLVSHIANHWRQIALATPQLWNKISLAGGPYAGKRTARAFAFISRCKSAPIDLSVTHLLGNGFPQDVLQLIGDHMGHCRQLCITDTSTKALDMAIQHLSPKSVPLLRSIYLTAVKYGEVRLQTPLFSSGAPHLRTVELGRFYAPTLHFCLPTLQSVTSLRLTGFVIEDDNEAAYKYFRDALMALHFLNHLDLRPDVFDLMQYHLPIVLPTIQYLHLDATEDPKCLGIIIHSVHAASLIAMSLDGWDSTDPDGEFTTLQNDLELHFPSLDHLILSNIPQGHSDVDVFARKFPDITRLTCEVSEYAYPYCDIVRVLTSICFGTQYDEQNEPLAPSDKRERWPKLRVLAVSVPASLMWVPVELRRMVSALRCRDSRPRKLLLPKAFISRTGADVIGELKGMVEIGDYILDWPTAFARCC